MKSRSQSQHLHHFGIQPGAKFPRSVFDHSHTHKTTINSGFLYPIMVNEVYPGDVHTLSGSFFARLTTPLKPVLDNIYMDVHYFYCPTRLLWANWEKFQGEQLNPADSIAYTIPTVQIPIGGPAVNTLFDYLGCPLGSQITAAYNVNALIPRMYNRI